VAIPREQQLFETMMSEGALSEPEVWELIRLPEGQYLDFKHGLELAKPKPSRTIRQYATGFANADGGLLVVGVSDGGADSAKRTFTNTPRPGGKPLDAWASDALNQVAGSFSPQPRIRAMTIDGCELLLIAVARAPTYIMCDGQYWFRFAQTTKPMPPFMVSDFLLGRRAHPVLELAEHESGCAGGNQEVRHFNFRVHNAGFLPGDDVLVGVISWGRPTGDPNHGRPLSAYLRNFVDLRPLSPSYKERGLIPMHTTSERKRPVALAAFQSGATAVELVADFEESPVPVRSAAYVVARGHPPIWYQFDWEMRARSAPDLARRARLTPCPLERPIVEWGAPFPWI
jgi:hypothetical protein